MPGEGIQSHLAARSGRTAPAGADTDPAGHEALQLGWKCIAVRSSVTAVRTGCPTQDSPARRLADAAEGFLRHGPGYWPGAGHFLLLEIDREGSCTGDARTVCRACTRPAAECVLARLARGTTTLLDLVGDDAAQPEPCFLCGGMPPDGERFGIDAWIA